MAEPTYAELLAQSAREWQEKQEIAAKRHREMMLQLETMPDVKQAPAPGSAWTHPQIECLTCRSRDFVMGKWVTVNGKRYRAKLTCATCGHTRVWGWDEMRWLN